MTISQRIVLAVFGPLLSLLFSWKVKGKENIPMTGPLILVANHAHVLDPLFLVFGLPRWITFMAKEELFRSAFIRAWLQWAGSLSIRRDGKVGEKHQILNSARSALEKGLVLGMFPEGGRSQDGKLKEGKLGSAVIASKTNVPILPVGIVGTDKIRAANFLWKRPHVVINVGKPFRLPPSSGRMSRSQMQLLTEQLMKEIAALLPPEYRGAYEKHED